MSKQFAAWLLCSTALTLILPMGAIANPKDGQVAAGSATIVQKGSSTLTINQTSQRAIINWQSFSIGKGETTNFNQPNATAITLNRVTGIDPSSIMGNLTANGQVWLINPNGIAFGKTARVDVAGLLATTIDIANSDFMSGTYRFTGLKNPSAMVTNAGHITIRDSGLAALVAPGVENSGVIQANLGQIQLSSTAAFTVDLYGDGLFNFTLDKQVTQAITKPDGTKPTAAVTNTGGLIADGGKIFLTANAARSVVDNSINMVGYAQATTAKVTNGEIVLDGGDEGTVQVAGTLDASGTSTGQTGGTVQVTGSDVNVASTATINVSGYTGGGTVLIGGDMHGTGPLRHASATTVASGASINADAVSNGNGGEVVVWSDTQTNYQGTISARGGAYGGNGGSAEVSSHGVLGFNGTADLRAPQGQIGTLLLDPENVTIAATGDSPTLPGSSNGPITLSANADDSVLSVTTLQSALSLANVTVSTGTTGSQAGDINVLTNISWNGANSLTLSAYRNITIGDGVTIANVGAGNLNFRADSTGTGIGTVVFNGTGKVDFSGSSGTVTIDYDPTGGYSTPANFTASVSGQLTSYMLVNTANDLENLQQNLAGIYALNRDIDLSSIADFVPIGTDTNLFTGVLNGFGHTISNLTVTDVQPTWVGLFGVIGSSGTVKSLVLSNVSISHIAVGTAGARSSLAGENFGTISDVVLNGAEFALVGLNEGSISNVQVTGFNFNIPTALSTGFSAGGIASTNDGTITNASVVGTMTVNPSLNNNLGGLVGYNSGTITNSSAAVSVNGCCSIGGLVGFNNGNVSRSYATGAVNGIGDGNVGGLAGGNVGNISQSYASGSVNGSGGTNAWIGGLVGYNGGGVLSASYATGTVNGGGSNNIVGGLVGWNSPDNGTVTITESYATGAVSASGSGNSVGGLVGYNNAGGAISASYWDTGTTTQSSGCGTNNGVCNATGLATADARTQANYSAFDFTNTWFIIDGQTRPFLRSEYSTAITNTHQLQLIVMNLGATYTLANNIDFTAVLAPDANGNYPGMWGSGGFVPIGNSSSQFTGTFDGGGHVINNLTINSTADNVGLFGYSGGTIRDIGLIGGSVSGGVVVGALVGLNTGTITQSYATGAVHGSGTVGGLVGLSDGTINNAYATGAVTGADVDIGGLVGYNRNGTITQSYATGVVSGTGEVGGLVGWNDSMISNVYATGAVTGSSSSSHYIGGLVGYSDGTINNAYAAGAVSGNLGVGGLVGLNDTGGTISISYWDIQTTDQSNGVGSGDASGTTGLTTAQFKTSLPTGFDPTIWAISSTINSGYPYLLSPTTGGGGPLPSTTVYFARPASVTLTWGVGDASSTYGTLATLGAVTLTGVSVVDQGSVNGTVGLFTGNTQVTLSPSLSAGTYTEEVVALTGSAASNYNLSQTGNTFGTLTINPAQLSLIVNDASRLYGTANPSFSATITGFKLGQDQSVLSGLTLSTTATQSSNVGSYAIVSSGGTATNYVIANRADGTLLVTAQPLTVTANSLSRLYGNANPTLTYAITSGSLYNGDTLSGGVATDATAISGVGNYAISEGTLSASSNYTLSYVPGTLLVTARPITVAANSASRTYGANNPLLAYSVTSGGLVNGDTLSGGLATSAATASSVGSYAITQGTLLASANYSLAFVPSTLTITPKTLTWTVTNVSSTYGTTPSQGSAMLYGVVGSDDVSGSVEVFNGSTQVYPTYFLSAGIYTEKVVSLYGAAASNYTLAPNGSPSGTLTINPKPLNWSVSSVTSTYGTTPVLGTTMLFGIVSIDDVNGIVGVVGVPNLSATTPVGSYTEYVIGLGGSKAGNYVLVSNNNSYGTLTIQQPPGYSSFVAQTSSPQNTNQTLPLAPVGTLVAYQFDAGSLVTANTLATANSPPAPAQTYYIQSGTGAMLTADQVRNGSFPPGTYFVESATGKTVTQAELVSGSQSTNPAITSNSSTTNQFSFDAPALVGTPNQVGGTSSQVSAAASGTSVTTWGYDASLNRIIPNGGTTKYQPVDSMNLAISTSTGTIYQTIYAYPNVNAYGQKDAINGPFQCTALVAQYLSALGFKNAPLNLPNGNQVATQLGTGPNAQYFQFSPTGAYAPKVGSIVSFSATGSDAPFGHVAIIKGITQPDPNTIIATLIEDNLTVHNTNTFAKNREITFHYSNGKWVEVPTASAIVSVVNWVTPVTTPK